MKKEIIEKIEIIINRHAPMDNSEIKEACAKDIYKEIFKKYVQKKNVGSSKCLCR